MDKPSLTIRPDKPVIPKKEPKGITVSVDMDTDKMQLKLRAIAKHVGALADELDAIDNTDIETLNEIAKSIGVLNSKTGNEIGNALCKCADLARSE